ncbi:protein kinase [Archangium violaceum]|uniref:serine/threonine-protein kinase n=1 Tax=Archangium violaceum TaxID=83451 RepID=UPI00194F4F21|nr:serine/threonine-protein kinase [Archangium violaceum]QRN96270.1 protein kinase [Archangium violaceum]
MNGVESGRADDRWLRAQRHRLWRQAANAPVEPQLPLPGTEVGGLLLEARLGTGSQGAVFRARSRSGRLYAVKFIYLPRSAAWAWRELEVLLRLRRLGWVAVRGHGEWPDTAPRFVYLVMEYVWGRALHEWARQCNPTARQVAQVVRALARQLAAVHRAQVVHRDVKCANVVVRDKDGLPVLVDFGVGTFPGAHHVTGPLVVGTALYRSPEAAAHQRLHSGQRYEASARDDTWALGVLLYWLLTGTYPFQVEESGDSLEDGRALGEAILHHSPEPPHVRNGRVPRALGEVCQRMLEKQPEERYPDALAVEAALEAALGGADATWDEPLCEAWGPDSATTVAEVELEEEEAEALSRRLEERARLHPRRGEPPPPREPSTVAAPLSEPRPPQEEAPGEEAPPVHESPRVEARVASTPPPARALPRRAVMVCAALALMLAVSALFIITRRSHPPPDPAPVAEESWMTPPVASLLPMPEVWFRLGQEVAPPWKPPEGDGGAEPSEAPTPAPVARATSHEEDRRVKTPLRKAPTPQSDTPQPKDSGSTASRAGSALLLCSLAAGCPGPTTSSAVRPTPAPAECPANSVQTMKELGLRFGDRQDVDLPGLKNPDEVFTVRSGPGAKLNLRGEDWGKLPDGTVFSGVLFVGETRVYGRFTEAHTPDGHAWPVCLEFYDVQTDDKRGVFREPGGGADTARIRGVVGLVPVERFE